MKQEIIDASNKSINNESVDINQSDMVSRTMVYHLGFKAGAEWQRNRVWHKVTEKPEEWR